MRFSFSLFAAALLALTLPLYVLAAPPANVTNVTATARPDGTISVQWTPVDDPNVTAYQIYWSSDSILANQGLYDDFEKTPGPQSSYTLVPPSGAGLLFITVDALNADGDASPSFVEEAIVDLSAVSTSGPTLDATPPSSVSSAPATPVLEMPEPQSSSSTSSAESQEVSIPVQTTETSEPVDQDVPEWEPRELDDSQLHLISAEAISNTGVLLTFSDAVTVDPAEAPLALLIEYPDGAPLQIVRIIIDEEEIEVHTELQERGTVYQVQLADAFHGVNGQLLHSVNRSSFFQGHPTGKEPQPHTGTGVQQIPGMQQQTQQPAQVDPQHPADVSNLRLRAIPQGNGYYTVEAVWEYDLSRNDLGMYAVQQTRDQGRTFGQPQTLPPNIGGVTIPNVEPGEFGLFVQTVNLWGYPSTGVYQNVTVGQPGVFVPQPPVANVTQPPVFQQPGTDVLPQSGTAEGMAVVLILGAVAGWMGMRRLQRA